MKSKAALSTRRPLLVFHLASQAYALPLEDVQEVVCMAHLSRPPGLPSVLEGFLNLEGTAVTVLRLAHLFELPDPPLGLYTPLLVLRNPDYRMALLVEVVNEIVTVAPEDVLPVRENDSFNDCVESMVTVNGRVVLLLSCERLLLEKEQQCLAEFQDREQVRLHSLAEASP